MNVACTDCGVVERLPDGDIVAPAHRCAMCAYAAEQVAAKRRAKQGVVAICVGLAVSSVAVIMFANGIELYNRHDDDDIGGTAFILFLGFALVVIGASQLQIRIRKLRE